MLNYSVSALLNRRDVEGTDIRSFEQLADQTRVTYGSLRDSRVMEIFGNTTDFMLSRMFALMHSRGVPVDSLQEAIQRVRRGKYAFIGDSYTVEEMAKSDCDLTVIRDNRREFRRHISIALPKGSDIVRIFNIHLGTLVKNGKMDEIRDRYWKSHCNGSTHLIPCTSSIYLFIVLIICLKSIFCLSF